MSGATSSNPTVEKDAIYSQLIGAKRSTVSLALSELTERGALVRQNGNWLLLESPPEPIGEMPRIEGPPNAAVARNLPTPPSVTMVLATAAVP